jgi:phosphate transport system substrate-binding protein
MTKPFVLAFALAMLGLVACKGKPDPQPAAQPGAGPSKPAEPVSLNGAGATFPYPLYSKWIAEYGKMNSNVRINYQSIGSGGGIRQMIAGTVDFGATDAPMSEEEAKSAPKKIVHVPTILGAVVLAYNLEGVTDLKISPEVLAGIYLGKIKKWNDPKIVADNPDVKLPAKDMNAVFRSDGSGTTAVFTDYLSKVSPEFKDKVGAGKSVSWPGGVGAKGNEGVTGQVKTTPGSLGYLELAYAEQNKLSMAALRNKAGEFIKPSIEATSAAAAGVQLPESLTVSITDSPAPGAYPIAAYTYIIVHEDTADAAKGKGVADFLWWAIHAGQQFAAPLQYAPLPAATVEQVEKRIKSLHSGGIKLTGG